MSGSPSTIKWNCKLLNYGKSAFEGSDSSCPRSGYISRAIKSIKSCLVIAGDQIVDYLKKATTPSAEWF
jgi:hypothetical protein